MDINIDPGIWIMDRYIIFGPYDKGGCSEVDWGWDTVCQKWVILKNLHQNKWEKVSHEIECSRKFNLRQCVKCTDWFQINQKYTLVFDYVDHLPLREIFTKFRWYDIQRFTGQLLWLLNKFHTGGMIHHDLKPSNLLLDKQTLDIRLIDYGMSLIGEPELTPKSTKWGDWAWKTTNRKNGTPAFLSPEQQMPSDKAWFPTPAVDIWAVGCILMEWWTGKTPFFPAEYQKKNEIFANMWTKKKWNYEWMLKQKREGIPDDPKMDRCFMNLISLCFIIKPEFRPTTQKLLQHKFIQSGTYVHCFLFQSIS